MDETEQLTTEQQEKAAAERAAALQGFHDLFHWYALHPEIPLPELIVSNYAVDDPKLIAKALRTFDKIFNDDLVTVRKRFGPVRADFVFMRDQACIRRVVGVKHVEAKTEYTPAHDEEIVEWDCVSILEPKEESDLTENT